MLKHPVRPADSEERKDQGFTLIELLVVVLIIGVLAAIAIPVFLNQREKAADAATQSDLKNAATLLETHFVDEQSYEAPATGDDLRLEGLQESDNVTVTITSATDDAFCLTGANTAGSGNMYYNSATGGLTDVACGATPDPEAAG